MEIISRQVKILCRCGTMRSPSMTSTIQDQSQGQVSLCFSLFVCLFVLLNVVVRDIPSGFKGVGFDFWNGQVGHKVAYGSPELRCPGAEPRR